MRLGHVSANLAVYERAESPYNDEVSFCSLLHTGRGIHGFERASVVRFPDLLVVIVS